MIDPESMTIVELQSAVRSGELTRREIVATHFARIDDHNSTINSFVELRGDEVLAEAAKADAIRGRTIVGALDAVPFSVKDSYAVTGLHRTDGLPINKDKVHCCHAPSYRCGGCDSPSRRYPDLILKSRAGREEAAAESRPCASPPTTPTRRHPSTRRRTATAANTCRGVPTHAAGDPSFVVPSQPGTEADRSLPTWYE